MPFSSSSRPLFVSSVVLVVALGCSSKSSPSSAGAKKTPGKTTTGAAAPAKPTTKPATKPKAPSTNPTTKPPATPPKTDPVDDSSALAADGAEIGDCTDYGLTDGQGYCLAGTDYVIGCVGSKVKALDCGSYDDANTLTSCEDDTSAGCYAVTLAAVDPDIIDDVASGEVVGSCRAPTVQAGRGLCSGDGKDLYVCSGEKLYALACDTYGEGLGCKSGDVGLTCQ